MCVHDLLYTKYIHPIVFKEFSLGDFVYAGIRFKWLAKILVKMTGFKHRYWKNTQKEIKRHKAEL
jgi:hypothetical protein